MDDKELITVGVFSVLAALVLLSGCVTASPRPLVECKTMCQGDKVEEFKDETMTCKCQFLGDKHE